MSPFSAVGHIVGKGAKAGERGRVSEDEISMFCASSSQYEGWETWGEVVERLCEESVGEEGD